MQKRSGRFTKIYEKPTTVLQEMNKTLKQIIKNMFSNWLAVLAQASIAFILVPFLITQLGREGYGLVGLLGVILGLTQIADLGLRGALGRELSEQVALKDTRHFNELMTTALVLYVCIAGGFALVGWVFAPWFVEIFKVSARLQPDAIFLIRLYGTGAVLFSFIAPVFDAALTSHNRFDVANSVRIFCGIFSGICMFIVLPMVSNPLVGWVAVMLLNHLLSALLSFLLVRRYCEGICVHFRYFQPRRLFPLFRLGGYIYALQLTDVLSSQSDPLVISYFFGPAGVALYQPGQRLSGMMRPIVTTIGNQLYPLTTKQHVNQEVLKMQQLLVIGTKYTLLLGVLATVGVVACADSLCRLWLFDSLGEDYRTVALIVRGWAVADFLLYAAGTQWSVLLGMKKLKFLVWTQLPTAVLNLLVSIYLVGFTDLGIPGVLIATILIGALRRPLLIAHTARACGVKTIDYLKQAYFRPLLLLCLLSGFAFGYQHFIPLESWRLFIGFCGAVSLAWSVLLLCIGMNRTERDLLWNEGRKCLGA